MKYQVHTSKQFRKDVRKLKRSSKCSLNKLRETILLLQEGKKLPRGNKNHKLNGGYKGYEECHIEPDWLLIYKKEKDKLILVLTRTGSHADLF